METPQQPPRGWAALLSAAAADEASASPLSRLSDHPLSLCLSFLSMQRRCLLAARVCRQWSRVAALPTSNAAMTIRLQSYQRDTEPPSQGLVRWASQRAAGGSSSSSSVPLLPSPPSIPCGSGAAYPYANSPIICLIAEHVGGSASGDNVDLGRAGPLALGTPNPACLSELLGWPNLARAAAANASRGVMTDRDIQRRASFESCARLCPAALQSLTIRSPFQEVDMDGDSIVLGSGDEEWADLLQWLAPNLATASATVAAPSNTGRYRYYADDAESVRAAAAAAAAVAAAAKAAAALQFDPADSPFPRLSSLTIEGSALSWPVVQTLLRACPSIVHLSVGADLSADCRDTCALLKTRGPDATVNGVRLSESRCGMCGDLVAPLLTCNSESCAVVACGLCLTAVHSERHHFMCPHEDGGQLSCYARGPCDDHVAFRCSDCDVAGDSSPGECGACGCLACDQHHAYGSCDHYPEVMYRCSNCRCRKCRYSYTAFDYASHDESDDDDEAEDEAEEDVEDAEGGSSQRAEKTREKKQKKVTHWRHG